MCHWWHVTCFYTWDTWCVRWYCVLEVCWQIVYVLPVGQTDTIAGLLKSDFRRSPAGNWFKMLFVRAIFLVACGLRAVNLLEPELMYLRPHIHVPNSSLQHYFDLCVQTSLYHWSYRLDYCLKFVLCFYDYQYLKVKYIFVSCYVLNDWNIMIRKLSKSWWTKLVHNHSSCKGEEILSWM